MSQTLKSYFPPDLLVDSMIPINEAYYIEMTNNKDVLATYHQIYEKLFKYSKFYIYSFDLYTPEMIRDFVDQYIEASSSWKNTVVTAINVMKNILSKSHPNTFPRFFLNDIKRYSGGNKNYSGDDILEPEELLTIKEKLINGKFNHKSRLIFCALYYDGIAKKHVGELFNANAFDGNILTISDGSKTIYKISDETKEALQYCKDNSSSIKYEDVLSLLRDIGRRLVYFGFASGGTGVPASAIDGSSLPMTGKRKENTAETCTISDSLRCQAPFRYRVGPNTILDRDFSAIP